MIQVKFQVQWLRDGAAKESADCLLPLRTLLIHGACAVIRVAERKANHADSWPAHLMVRRNKNVATVAPANKNARIVWALLAHNREYEPDYQSAA